MGRRTSGREQPARYWDWIAVGLQGAVLFGFWVALSGRYETKFLVIGALAVAAVVLLNREIFSLHLHPVIAGRGHVFRALLAVAWTWLAYVGWLLYAIVVANFQVAYIVLHPRMPIDPVLLQFNVPWRRAATQVVLANSITLTPGTITADLKDGQYTVHTLATAFAQPLSSGEMQRRVALLLGEESPIPTIKWVRAVGALEQ